jgi:hypothetical protein
MMEPHRNGASSDGASDGEKQEEQGQPERELEPP